MVSIKNVLTLPIWIWVLKTQVRLKSYLCQFLIMLFGASSLTSPGFNFSICNVEKNKSLDRLQ